MNISKVPQILILILQRINYQNKVKNECLVNFEELLDISKYIDIDCESEKNFKYIYNLNDKFYTFDNAYVLFYIKSNSI